MLGKLLKYEFKATARLFLPLYAVLLVFAVINKILNPFQRIEESAGFNGQDFLSIISVIIYFTLIVGVAVMTLVIIVQRFYKNLLGDEGYLMFTLPVETWKQILSKLIVAVLWYFMSFIAVMSSILVLAGFGEVLKNLPEMFRVLKEMFGYTGIVSMPVLALASIISNTLMIYNAIALGHLFSKHRLLASFGMYCALYGVIQAIYALFILAAGGTFFTPIFHGGAPTISEMNKLFISIGILELLIISGHFLMINTILKKRLNLE